MELVKPGNVFLVTGATGAIGFEVAAQAAAAGAIVAVHGSRAETVASAITRLNARVAGAQLIPAAADFKREGDIERMVAAVVAVTGRLDAVIHCGITGAADVTGPLAKTNPANYASHAALVLGTVQRLSFAALPHLSIRGGTIISFASDAGRFGAPRQSLIGASFAGVMNFVRNLALEVSRDGVRVHCISPSFVENTPTFEQHADRAGGARSRAGLGLPSPEDIAPIVLFLCGPGATKITGQIISVNGGLNA
jgi:3-oxoacyl-[acyl-carrier protein] reductase